MANNDVTVKFQRLPPMPGAAVAEGRFAFHPKHEWILPPPGEMSDDAGFHHQAGMDPATSIRHVTPLVYEGVDRAPILYAHPAIGQALVGATMSHQALLPGRYAKNIDRLARYRRIVAEECKKMGGAAPHIAIIDKVPRSENCTLGEALRSIEAMATAKVGEAAASEIRHAMYEVLRVAITAGIDPSTPLELPSCYYVQKFEQGENFFALLGTEVFATSGAFTEREHTGDAVGVWIIKPADQPMQFVVYHMRPVPVSVVGRQTEIQLYHAGLACVGHVGEGGMPVVDAPSDALSSIRVWAPEGDDEGLGGVTIAHGDVSLPVPPS